MPAPRDYVYFGRTFQGGRDVNIWEMYSVNVCLNSITLNAVCSQNSFSIAIQPEGTKKSKSAKDSRTPPYQILMMHVRITDVSLLEDP